MTDKAPKKIWVPEAWCKDLVWERDPDTEITYIREDVVFELVEALKTVRCWTSLSIHNQYHVPIIEAALKKLEESHD